ncbi:MAG: replicative DNA helicase [Candidatus Delongbacteria bacterium]|nr:replicative DNA helicase [Candidatus Delongbacteria bacterium]MCG2759719.1 replicative DNA helicase [Candidatus Delongbacteria bacterium]
MTDDLKKIPPHDLEIEKALLCCIMMDEDWGEKLTDIDLKEEYFYSKQHQYIYEAVTHIVYEGDKVDLLSLKDYLHKSGKLSEAGGAAYLGEVLDAVSTSANIRHYAKIIEDKYLLRSLINISTESITAAFREEKDAFHLLDKLNGDIFSLAENKKRNIPQPLEKVVLDTFGQIEEWSQKKGELSGITSGYHELDNYTAGWQNSNLIVLAARPSMGKTQLALNFAVNAAKSEERTSVAVFSIEMGRKELAMRLLSMVSNVSLRKLRTGNLADNEWTSLGLGMGELGALPVYIDDSSSLNVLELRTKARRLKKDKNIGFIIIDYIGLMETESNIERHEGISRISRSLKGLSKELDIPIMVLSQLNREVDKRQDKKPILSDLRESGAIEQDADLVLFILRPELYGIKDQNGKDQEGLAEVIIGKQRSGPTGSVFLHFDKKYLKFEENIDRFAGNRYDL